MTEGQIIALVRNEIRKHQNMLFTGVTAENTPTSENVDLLFGAQDKNLNIPVVKPYGLASRAPEGKIAVVAKTSYDPRSKILLGHRDTTPPEMAQGETVLYNGFARQVRLEQNALRFGSQASTDPMVLGTEMMDCITTFVKAFTEAQYVVETPLGPGVLSPTVRLALTQMVTKFITTASTNIVSQVAFTERGGS